MFSKYKLILPFCFLLPVNSYAATIPKAGSFDTRMQTVFYNPNDVTIVKIKIGRTTVITFEEGETIEKLTGGGLTIGDSAAWTIKVRGNHIFLKPKASFPDTNMGIITNNRRYSISLQSAKKESEVAYFLDYAYPAKNKNMVELASARKKDLPCTNIPDKTKINLDYYAWGDMSLIPASVWDDGQFACFRYQRSNNIPSFYTVDKYGKETIGNVYSEDDIVIVQAVSNEYRLRLGSKSVMGIKSNSFVKAPYNRSMTTEKGIKREVIDNE